MMRRNGKISWLSETAGVSAAIGKSHLDMGSDVYVFLRHTHKSYHFLLSDECNWMTGQGPSMDVGLSIIWSFCTECASFFSRPYIIVL
jgi:hypothetical protein